MVEEEQRRKEQAIEKLKGGSDDAESEMEDEEKIKALLE